MSNQKFYVDQDGDVRTTSQNIQQSGYFMGLDPGYTMTIDGDKYRSNGEGKRATKLDVSLSEISDVPPWL